MLRANVGLSRKVTRDYNSTGYSVNLDGEIPASVDDAETIIEKVRELFTLAQEALFQEIDRDQGEDAIGRRDEERPVPPNNPPSSVPNNTPSQPPSSAKVPPKQTPPAPANQAPSGNGNHRPANDDAATNKQVQFLLTMAKRFKLSTPQLEGRIGEITGRRCGVYDMTKKEAGMVLDAFTQAASNGNGRK